MSVSLGVESGQLKLVDVGSEELEKLTLLPDLEYCPILLLQYAYLKVCFVNVTWGGRTTT